MLCVLREVKDRLISMFSSRNNSRDLVIVP
jgi:hypothetical protein